MNDAEKLSPMVDEAYIGIRELKKIKIWPLSIADQKEMAKEIVDAIQLFFQSADEDETLLTNDVKFVEFMIGVIVDNLVRIIQKTTDYTTVKTAEGLLAEIHNNQAADIALIIYKQNFESALKNVKSLLDKINTTFLSKRLSPQFAPNTDIALSTSTDFPTEKEE